MYTIPKPTLQSLVPPPDKSTLEPTLQVSCSPPAKSRVPQPTLRSLASVSLSLNTHSNVPCPHRSPRAITLCAHRLSRAGTELSEEAGVDGVGREGRLDGGVAAELLGPLRPQRAAHRRALLRL